MTHLALAVASAAALALHAEPEKIPSVPFETFKLPNGLNVILSEDHTAPIVGVDVHYDVGSKDEKPGRTGFAHLFEHLMFQGSESVEKLAHFRYVQGSGGTCNATTQQDWTQYHQVVPAVALERALFCEADRMRAPRLTAENLRNQVDVVSEEIRLNVLDRPYGGFPWLWLPPVLYRGFANAHNGYGDFTDLNQATVEDCAAFFDAYYPPANAVLTIAGDVEVGPALALVERHFGDVPARPAAKRVDTGEPSPGDARRAAHADAKAPLPAVAVGYRLPPPSALDAYLAHVVLAATLADGETSRLRQRLVHQDALVVETDASCGFFGPFQARDPDTFVLTATHPGDVTADQVLTAADEEVRRLAEHG
ncbi:MAG: M16 family metallopeptidase, partial [Anaeromyxobacteraceae bacterium]